MLTTTLLGVNLSRIIEVLSKNGGFQNEFWDKSGAGEPIRTVDLLITSQLLYQLSYTGSIANFMIYHLPVK